MSPGEPSCIFVYFQSLNTTCLQPCVSSLAPPSSVQDSCSCPRSPHQSPFPSRLTTGRDTRSKLSFERRRANSIHSGATTRTHGVQEVDPRLSREGCRGSRLQLGPEEVLHLHPPTVWQPVRGLFQLQIQSLYQTYPNQRGTHPRASGPTSSRNLTKPRATPTTRGGPTCSESTRKQTSHSSPIIPGPTTRACTGC